MGLWRLYSFPDRPKNDQLFVVSNVRFINDDSEPTSIELFCTIKTKYGEDKDQRLEFNFGPADRPLSQEFVAELQKNLLFPLRAHQQKHFLNLQPRTPARTDSLFTGLADSSNRDGFHSAL